MLAVQVGAGGPEHDGGQGLVGEAEVTPDHVEVHEVQHHADGEDRDGDGQTGRDGGLLEVAHFGDGQAGGTEGRVTGGDGHVGGSSKMPQVMSRVKSEFGIETKMFDPDESVAKGAAIYANKMSEFNIVLEEIAKQQGKSVEEVKEQVDKGQMDIQKEAKKANIQMRGGRLPGEDVKIINVSSRSFGTCAYDETDQLKLFNIIIKNAELPATGTNSFYPRQNNQRSVRFQVMECLASDEKVDPELGKEIGTAELTLPAGVTLDTEIQVTFRLDESGLLHLHAKETNNTARALPQLPAPITLTFFICLSSS